MTFFQSYLKAKGNASVIQNLISWSETIAKTGRETQKRFLKYCLQFFRQAMLYNYNAESLVYLEPYDRLTKPHLHRPLLQYRLIFHRVVL